MTKNWKIIVTSIILCFVLITCVYYFIFSEQEIVVTGRISLELCEVEDYKVAWTLFGDNDEQYYLAYSNWTLIEGTNSKYIELYDRKVVICGVVKEYSSDEISYKILKVTEIDLKNQP